MKQAALSFLLAAALAAGTALSVGAAPLPPGTTAVPLVAITNDRDTSVSEIELMLGPQKFVRGLYIETYRNEREPDQATGQVIPLARIETPEGTVVGKGQGVKAILVQGRIEPKGNGTLDIKYLANGIFGRYEECTVHLRHVAPNHWELVNAYNQRTVHHIHVKTWALGISTLENVCPTGQA